MRVHAAFFFDLVCLPLLVGGCCSLNDQLQQALAMEQASLADSHTVRSHVAKGFHLTVEFDLEALERHLQSGTLINALPRFSQRIHLGYVTVGIEGRISALSLGVSSQCDACLDVQAQVELELVLSAPDVGFSLPLPLEAFHLPTRLRFTCALKVAKQENGFTALMLDLTQPAEAALDLALDQLPRPWAQSFRDVLSPMASVIARATLGNLKLANITPLDLGVGRLTLTIETVRTQALGHRLWLGIKSNLALPEEELIQPSDQELREEVRIRFASRLPELALWALLQNGDIPRRYDSSFQPHTDGPFQLTLHRFRFDESSCDASVRLWHDQWPCFYADLAIRFLLKKNRQNRFFASLERMELERASEFEERIRQTLGRPSKLTAILASVSEQWLNQQFIQLSSTSVCFAPSVLVVGPKEIEIEGSMTFHPNEKKRTMSLGRSTPRMFLGIFD